LHTILRGSFSPPRDPAQRRFPPPHIERTAASYPLTCKRVICRDPTRKRSKPRHNWHEIAGNYYPLTDDISPHYIRGRFRNPGSLLASFGRGSIRYLQESSQFCSCNSDQIQRNTSTITGHPTNNCRPIRTSARQNLREEGPTGGQEDSPFSNTCKLLGTL
jgi:hypothetical protein